MSARKDWIWMPHAGHLIVGSMCRFKLNTFVGHFIVSTVGEYVPDSGVREILYQNRKGGKLPRGDAGEYQFLKELGFEEIGFGRTYETMVFRAAPTNDKCCPFRIADPSELETAGYQDPGDAFAGHMRLCAKWSRSRP